MENNPLLEFIAISKHRMVSHYLPKLTKCLEQLENRLIWTQESQDANSIGGIVAHLLEHMKRNTLRLSESDVKFGKGIEDTFPQLSQDKALLIQELQSTFADFEKAMDTVNPSKIDMFSLYHLVEHFGYHLGQIIDRTQRLTQHRFQFVQNGINERALKALIEHELSSKQSEIKL